MLIEQQIALVAKTLRCNFTLRNAPVSYEQVFSPSGLLPAMMRSADQLSMFCLGYGLGVSFEEEQGAILGVKVKFDDATPNSLRIMCLTDVLIEIIQTSPSREVIPLDDLLIN